MPYITSANAVKILGISKRTLFRWEKEGKIANIRDNVSKARIYDQDYIKQTAEILELDRQEKEHCAKLPAVMENVRRYLFVSDVHETRATGRHHLMDIDKASEAMDEEAEWTKEHQRILDEMYVYPKKRLRELLLPKDK